MVNFQPPPPNKMTKQKVDAENMEFQSRWVAENCMVPVWEVVCPDKRQLFLNVSLSRNTIAEGVDQLSADLKEQLVRKGKEFFAFPLL